MTLTLAAAALIVAGFVARATAGPPWALLLPNPATVAVPLLLVALVTLAQRFAPRALPAALVAWLLAVASAWPRACGPIGDGPTWRSLVDHPVLVSSEALGRWSHYVAGRALALAGLYDPDRALHVASVAAGVVWVALVGRLARDLAPSAARSAWVTLLLLAPPLQLFLGYPETTPWAYALYGVYLLLGLRSLRRRSVRPPWDATVVLALALLAHGAVCFGTGSHAVLTVAWFDSAQRVPTRARFATAAALAVAPFAPLALVFALSALGGSGSYDIEWYGNALGGTDFQMFVRAGALADPRRLRDLTLLAAWMAPTLLLAPWYLARVWRRARVEAAFLAVSVACLLAFAVTWDADFGAYQDADLLSLVSIPLAVLAAEAHMSEACGGAAPLVLSALTFVATVAPTLGR